MPPEKLVVIAIAAFDSVLGTRVPASRANSCTQGVGQGVRHRSSLRPGLTLLELLVVLALMGLVLAVAAPAFIVPRANEDSGLGAVVATARRAAILRAEPVTVTLDSDGVWHIDGDVTPMAPPIAAGRLASTVGELRLRVSPMGTCIPDRLVATRSEWNALDCRLSPVAAEAAAR
jgi:prepilin-type N-terminal cleavage/methylation domain-containing protein